MKCCKISSNLNYIIKSKHQLLFYFIHTDLLFKDMVKTDTQVATRINRHKLKHGATGTI